MKSGEKLRAMRQNAKKSQADVRDAMGYGSVQFISNWERNLCMPPVKAIKKLSRLYGVETQEIGKLYVDNFKANLAKFL